MADPQRPPVPKYSAAPAAEPASANPDAPAGHAVPVFARQLPRADFLSRSVAMTPRTVGYSKTHVVMTPRATPSAFDRPSLPSGKKPASSSKTRVVAGPARSGKERSLFDAGYQDRAAERRRHGDEEQPEPVALDLALLDSKRREVEAARVVPHAEAPEGPPVYALRSQAVLRAMGLLPAEPRTPSMWEPGRCTLAYDFGWAGPLPQPQLRSEAELQASGAGRRRAGQAELEQQLLRTIQAAFAPKTRPAECAGPAGEPDLEDMFADDAGPAADGPSRHRDRLAAGARAEAPSTLPVGVQHILAHAQAQAPARAQAAADKTEGQAGGLFGFSDLPRLALTAGGPGGPADDYDECYPGVYEGAGIEHDSEGEADDGPAPSRKRAAAQDQRRTQRRLDKDTSQVERLMRDKYGAD